ncbi:RRM domain-containing protein, partial [Trichostrongylus colubriformis]
AKFIVLFYNGLMDENFNSLAEEQKEPGFIKGPTEGGEIEEKNRTEEVNNNNIEDASDDLHSSTEVDHPTLEKLAGKFQLIFVGQELTAVMSRFELDVVSAARTPQRARSKSEPTQVGRLPKTVVVKSLENVNENLPNDYITTSESTDFSEISSPPTATSERKEIVESFPSRVICGTQITFDDRHGLYRHFKEQWRGQFATATVADSCCKGYMWSGELPPRNYSNPTFSSKIFVGGVPWDISESALNDAFSPYGACRVEWPSKEGRSNSSQRSRTKVTGYVYIVFETERSVKLLLQDCSQEFGSAGEWYFKLKARRNQSSEIRQVQVIPWVVSDSSYCDDPSCHIDPKKTVFVGALHGMITAHVLFSIMNELYGNVAFVGIDTDKYRYPIGSGRVTFRAHSSYFHAIESAFLEIRTSKFCKKVQIDPFLEDSWCMVCCENPGPYFCRDRTCFRYYCVSCWQARHTIEGKETTNHRPLTRHAPRTGTPRADDHSPRGELVRSLPRSYLQSTGNVTVAPLGGMAAVTAVARGTVPRQQRHAYQYMQLAPAYPSAVYSPTMIQPHCRVGSSIAPGTPVAGQSVTTSPPFIHQRLY